MQGHWQYLDTLTKDVGFLLHSQKQSAHWAVDITAQVVPC